MSANSPSNTSSKPIVRFAPSPTGHIHIGNARTALINWIVAKKSGGEFILRFDDTDKERSKTEFAEAILADLAWLGIAPDRIEYQSKRAEAHEQSTQTLIKAGLLYPCYETQEELEKQRKRLAMRGRPPVYDRSALKLSDDEKAELEREGRKPHWRFLLPNHEGDPFSPKRHDIAWDDLVRGSASIDLASMSDPVLVREDGSWLYTLPSVTDDIDMGVNHIIRGDDHVTNTAAQIAIFTALGARAPIFGHHNLLTSASGEGLSKRSGSLSIGALRDDGYEPMAVSSLATLIGTSGPVEAVADMDALVARFEISEITKSAAKFDVAELDTLNAKIVHEMSYEAAKPRLEAAGVGGGDAFWQAIKGNLVRLSEAAKWWQRIDGGDFDGVIDDADRDFIAQAVKCLPAEPWDEETFSKWTGELKAQTGRKGRTLFMPLRKALTGVEHGPELGPLLPIIGRERALARLS